MPPLQEREPLSPDIEGIKSWFSATVLPVALNGNAGLRQSSGAGNHVSIETPGGADVVALIHVRPPGASAAPSPTDIFGLNKYRDNTDFVGDIIISGDDRYMVSVTDADKYNSFVGKKSEYYDVNTPSQWKDKSKISREYRNFIDDANDVYKGADLVFPTMLYLMKNFKGGMGASLQKWDSTARAFTPVHVEADYDNSSGSTVNLGGGQTIHSPYSSVTIKPGCN
jgi:hypothetical protein